jgi:membrane-associated phospholipid phosphatase
VADPDWLPLLTTPNHPDYVAGHATFSAAAAAILTDAFGEQAFSATSVTLPGVTRSFDGFADAAAEAGQSRIYAGIHFPSAVEDGLALGHEVGTWVLDALRPSCGGWDLLG